MLKNLVRPCIVENGIEGKVKILNKQFTSVFNEVSPVGGTNSMKPCRNHVVSSGDSNNLYASHIPVCQPLTSVQKRDK